MSFCLYQILYHFSHYANYPISINYTSIRQVTNNILHEAWQKERYNNENNSFAVTLLQYSDHRARRLRHDGWQQFAELSWACRTAKLARNGDTADRSGMSLHHSRNVESS
jgi:hypothetical protein